MPPRRRSAETDQTSWRSVEPAPVILLSGSEEHFATQARRRVLASVIPYLFRSGRGRRRSPPNGPTAPRARGG